MICGKCKQKIDTVYGYIRTNGNVYHNGACPSDLPTAGVCNDVPCVITGVLPNVTYIMIPSMEHKQLKDTIESQSTQIEQLQESNKVLFGRIITKDLEIAELQARV
jgi:hypothetical protein